MRSMTRPGALLCCLLLASCGRTVVPEVVTTVAALFNPNDCVLIEARPVINSYPPKFLMLGQNTCQVTIPRSGLTVKFYNADDERIGVSEGLLGFHLISLAPGEKFRHVLEIPKDVLEQGTVTLIRVSVTK